MIESAEFAPSEGLQWVRKELATTITYARNSLQKFSDHPEDREPLLEVAKQLHVAHGALRMVEVYGAALLVEEMVTVTTKLYEDKSDSGEESLEALSRAIVQLPSYLDRIAGGGHDVPLLLLPLLNDLRAVRGSPLLSESSLFVLNVDQGATTPARSEPSPQIDYRVLAKKMRPHYQRALLGWLKGEQIADNLRVLTEVVKRLEEGAATTAVYQFWWVLGGVIEAIGDLGLRAGASVKRLLGQADRELKMLSLEGEEFFVKQPPRSLLNNLLYYVARADSRGTKVAAIKSSFSLANVVQPDSTEYASEQTMLQAPSVDLMKTVGAAIKQDVARVKDAIDIFVRTGSNDYAQLIIQRESLKKLSDTLGVLGLDELRQQVAGESRRLFTYIEESKTTDDELLEIASTLIDVESAIEEQLLGIIIRPQKPTDEPPLSTREMAAQADMKQVTSAVLRECVVNLTRIKEAFSQFIDKPANGGAVLDTIPGLLRGIAAGLNMLDKQRAADLLGEIERHITALTRRADIEKHTHELDRLADAIVSIEYYMETIRSGRSEPVYMLENAESCLLSMSPLPAAEQVAGTAAVPTVVPATEGASEGEPKEAAADSSKRVKDSAHDEALVEATGVRAAAQPVTPKRAVFDGHLPPLNRPLVMMEGRRTDPELLELFIEEAKEEVASLRRSLPRWQQDTEGRDVLLTMRRSFHTLKGSGRMVGAQLIGEYAWGMENLVNKLISRHLVADEHVETLLIDGIDGLPQLIEQLEVGTQPAAELVDLIDAVWRRADMPRQEPEIVDDFAAEPGSDEASVVADASDAAGAADTPERAAAQKRMAQAVSALTASGATGTTEASGVPEQSDAIASSIESDAPHAEVTPEDVARITAGETDTAGADSAKADPGDAEAADESFDPTATMGSMVPGVVLEMQPAEPDYSEEDDSPNQVAAPAIVLDAALYEIFSKETLEHLAVVDEFVEECAGRIEPVPVSEMLHRAWHTLSGSSNIANVAPAAAIATPINNHLRGLLAEGQPLNAQAIDILHRASVALASIVHGINTEPVLPDTRELLADIETLPELGAAALQAVMELDGTGEVRLPDQATAVGYDPEIAAIFAEEATEILEAANEALTEWFREPATDSSHLLELLRHLHTLKGGARMAGVSAIGDVSHETESVLERIRDADLALNDAARQVLQLSFDGMHSMTEQLHNGQAVDSGRKILERIAALDDPDATAATSIGESPVAGQSPAEGVTDGSAHEVRAAGEATGAQQSTEAEAEAEATGDDAEAAATTPEWSAAESGDDAVTAGPTPTSDSTVPEHFATDDAREIGSTELDKELPQAPVDFGSADGLATPVSLQEVASSPIPEQAEGTAAAHLLPADSNADAARDEPGEQRQDNRREKSHDKARIDARLLDEMLNNAGEVSIFHSRLEDQVGSISFNLTELQQTVARLREQLRKMEIETEAQILHRYQGETAHNEEFDPLELDRYSGLQQLSRALAESVSDLVSLQDLMTDITRESESLLVQQARVTGELQDALIRARMLPFERYVPRFERILRQVANEQNKQVALTVAGGSGELDRQVLQRMLPPFEHMLRNAVIHGIELPADREAQGKSAAGEIRIELQREGAEMVIRMSDDGCGLDLDRIREKALQQGVLKADQTLSDTETYELILRPGFSTATTITQSAGRGVGMDVVANEVKMLGGSLKLESTSRQGTTIVIRLPLTLAISQALLVRCGDERFALPLPAVESIVRVPHKEITAALYDAEHQYEHNGNKYSVRHLGPFLGGPEVNAELLQETSIPVILIRAGEQSCALLVDELLGSREVVVKSAGPMVAGITGITGATILGDGSIVVILDVAALIRNRTDKQDTSELMMAVTSEDLRPVVLVVDDSITVRRVTQRLLERNSMRVLLAKDGVDAVAIMQEQVPDLVLLDIEMPRMDGYEVASHIRNTEALQHVPITMITSRVGDKHRARAFELGVDKYLGKPYQENQLLDVIQPLLARSVKQRR